MYWLSLCKKSKIHLVKLNWYYWKVKEKYRRKKKEKGSKCQRGFQWMGNWFSGGFSIGSKIRICK